MRILTCLALVLASVPAFATEGWVIQPDFPTKIVQGFSFSGTEMPAYHVDQYVSQMDNQCAVNYSSFSQPGAHKLGYQMATTIKDSSIPDTKRVSVSCQYMVVTF